MGQINPTNTTNPSIVDLSQSNLNKKQYSLDEKSNQIHINGTHSKYAMDYISINPKNPDKLKLNKKEFIILEVTNSSDTVIKTNSSDTVIKIAVKIKSLLKPLNIFHSEELTNVQNASTKDRMELLTALVDFPKENETKKEWVSKIMENCLDIDSKNESSKKICLKLPMNKIKFYKELQEKIADRLPKESTRPTIELEIIGDNAKIDAEYDFGIIGGVGCLSDANLITDTVTEMLKNNPEEAQNIKIHLLSCPPPRGLLESKGLLKYGMRISNFFKQNHAKTIIASNTAHVNFDFLKKFDKKGTLEHIPKKIATGIKTDRHTNSQGHKNVLVMGTMQAYKAKLYPKILASKEVKVDSQKVNKKQAKELQRIIDNVKSNKLNDQDKESFLSMIKDSIEDSIEEHSEKPSHLLLACTELPLIINTIKEEQGQDFFNQEPYKGVNFVDSEHEMSQFIQNTVGS